MNHCFVVITLIVIAIEVNIVLAKPKPKPKPKEPCTRYALCPKFQCCPGYSCRHGYCGLSVRLPKGCFRKCGRDEVRFFAGKITKIRDINCCPGFKCVDNFCDLIQDPVKERPDIIKELEYALEW